MIVRRVLGLGAVAALALSTVACGGDAKPQSAASRKVRVALSAASAETLLIPYGVANGIFKDHGLDVDWTVLNPGTLAIAGLVSGDINIAQVAAPTGENAIVQGANLEIIAVPLHHILFALVARPGITSVKDLAGKVIAISGPGTPTDLFAAELLRDAGLDPETDVEMRTMGSGPERIAAMVAGQADATIVGLPSVANAVAKTGGSVLVDLSKSDIAWPFMSLAVDKGYAAKNNTLIVDFLKAFVESIKRFKTDSEGAQKVIAKETNQPDPVLVADGYKLFVDLLDETPAPEVQESQRVLDIIAITEPKAKDFKVERLFNTTYIDEALKSTG